MTNMQLDLLGLTSVTRWTIHQDKTGPSEKITSRLQGPVIRSSDLEEYELGCAYSLDKMIRQRLLFKLTQIRRYWYLMY